MMTYGEVPTWVYVVLGVEYTEEIGKDGISRMIDRKITKVFTQHSGMQKWVETFVLAGNTIKQTTCTMLDRSEVRRSLDIGYEKPCAEQPLSEVQECSLVDTWLANRQKNTNRPSNRY